ncbi:hypothetical protein [Duffyella gerundensis]|uniref:hypothetical protein n=1 Tax=Duffyella gerundensis TaxID=1619313 RepID=UPI003FD2F36C
MKSDNIAVLLTAAIACFSLPAAHALCLFGSTEGEISDYKNSYWQPTEPLSEKASKQIVANCTQQAAVAQQRLTDTYLQLCTTGQITGANRLFAEKLRHNPLYANLLTANPGAAKAPADNIEAQMRWSVTNDDSMEGFKEDCAAFVKRTPQDRANTLLGLKINGFQQDTFAQCMTQNHMQQVVPKKKFSACKSLGW